MSLLGFQRALADLAASPALCIKAIEDPAPVLRNYELTAREHTRLAVMVRDRLMSTNCTLYRVNRITPIYIFFPRTCHALGTALRQEMDAFWSAHRGVDLQYLPETSRFVTFLKQRPHNPKIQALLDEEADAMHQAFQ